MTRYALLSFSSSILVESFVAKHRINIVTSLGPVVLSLESWQSQPEYVVDGYPEFLGHWGSRKWYTASRLIWFFRGSPVL